MINIKETIVFDEAVSDIEAGKLFYDMQQKGVGDYFVDSIISDIESLVIYAGTHKLHLGFYRMLSKRFPFAIYYDCSDNIATIIAVLDMRMKPFTVKKALFGRSTIV